MQQTVADKSCCDVEEISGKNASLSMSSGFLNTSATEAVPAKSCDDVQEIADNGSPSETAESVESKNCPEAITDYLHYFEKRKTLMELSANARKHLLSIGWEIGIKTIRNNVRYGRNWRIRERHPETFTSPDKSDYYSLERALRYESWKLGPDLPEAISEYFKFLKTCYSDDQRRKTLRVLSAKAQEYLLSTGWRIVYKRNLNRGHFYTTKKPDKFTSPYGKNYFSLLQACKAVRDDAAPQQSSKSANSEPKGRMIPDGTSDKGFSSSQEDVHDEFFDVLKDFQQHEVAQGGDEPSKEDDDDVSAFSEDESEKDSHEHREKRTNSVDDFVYHPDAADELLLDPSWLPPPPAMLSEAMDLQHTSANQMAALILYTTRMLAQKASCSRLSDQEKMESQAARIASLEAVNSTLLSERAELSKTVDDLKRELGEAEEVKKKEIREAEEAAVSKFVGSNRMTSWVNYYNTYRATLILQMVRAQTGAMGLEDFQLDMDDRLGFPVHPPPYEHPRPGTFADDGDHPIDAWEISELKTKTVLAEGVSTSALPNPCTLFKTLSASSAKRKVVDMNDNEAGISDYSCGFPATGAGIESGGWRRGQRRKKNSTPVRG